MATLTLALQAVDCFAPRRLHRQHSPATKGCTRRRRRLSATNEELLNAIQALAKRIDDIAADVELLKKSRVDGLEAELERLRASPPASTMTTAEALRTPPEPRTSARTAPGLNAALSARAALGAVRGQAPATSPALRRAATTYDADEVEELGGEAFFFEGGGGKNDEFLDDEMEELLAIGGDPTFLEQARGGSGEFEWDGVEDDAAHFDDPVD
jgi:hypothetical protein